MPLLLGALDENHRRVQRAAARALRPFLAHDPNLIHTVLPQYATHVFDGSFSHAGLLDTHNGTIWVPRFAAVKGHAALLADGDTDRFYKFEYYLPNQAPTRLRVVDSATAHLVIHLILDWSYLRRSLIPEWDERRLLANREEQLGYASQAIAFYAACDLPVDVVVHHQYAQSSETTEMALDVQRIPKSARARATR